MSEVRLLASVAGTIDPALRDKAFARMGGETVEAAPGAFLVEASDGGQLLWFCCPCGCGDIRHIPANGGKNWTLENPESPTVAPSIFTHMNVGRGDDRRTEPHWHGFLRAGKWEQA